MVWRPIVAKSVATGITEFVFLWKSMKLNDLPHPEIVFGIAIYA